MFRYGLGRYRLSKKHDEWSPIQWLAAAGVLGFAFFLLFSLISESARDVFVTFTSLYIMLVIFFSFFLTLKEKTPVCLIFGPLIFPTIHFGLGTGFLFGLFEKYINHRR